MHDFLAMGGYAAYVWPSFGVAIVVLGGLALQSWAARRRLRRALGALDQTTAIDRSEGPMKSR
jgi:heme exporter protein D